MLGLALSSAGCGASGASTEAPPHTGTATESTATTTSTCMPPDLASAHELELVRLPAGCSFVGAGTFSAPRVVSDEAALASAIECTGASSASLDLAAGDLVIAGYTMSPAFGGLAIVDDGSTVTFVTRDRPPCPDDPMPMPMPASALAFRLPHGSSRTFAQRACTLASRCP